MSNSEKELKIAYDEYVKNSPGVDEYAMELFNAQDRRIKELEEENELKDKIIQRVWDCVVNDDHNFEFLHEYLKEHGFKFEEFSNE